MPQFKFKTSSGGFETREISDAEATKYRNSAGFIPQQGREANIQEIKSPTSNNDTSGVSGISDSPAITSFLNSDPPKTVDTPTFATALSGEDQSAIRDRYNAELEAQIADYRAASEQRIKDIQQKGKESKGATTGFLAKAGALGRSLTGAVESGGYGTGVLDKITNNINQAIADEQAALQREIAGARTANTAAIEKASADRLKYLNDLKQQTFQNATADLNNWLQIRQDARATAQESRLSSQEKRELEKESRDNMVAGLNFMLTNFGTEVLGSMTSADLNQYETELGLPEGSLAEGFKIVQEKAANSPKTIKSSSFQTNPLTGDVTVAILYEDGTTETQPLGAIGNRLKPTPGPGSTDDSGLTAEEKAFYADIEKAQQDLRSGTTWGQAFDLIKSKWGAPDDVIDKLLDKGNWGKTGAYQDFKKGSLKDTSSSSDFNKSNKDLLDEWVNS